MAFSEADLKTIERAIASGVLVVQLDGKRVQHHTVPELFVTRDRIKSELAAASGSPRATSAVAEFTRD